MEKKRKIEKVVRKVSFAEADEIDVAYYASIDWKESVSNAEKLRKMVWSDQYKNGIEKIIRIANLKEDRDEFE
jgi:hypothetical protein